MTQRLADDIKAEMKALEASGKKNPAKMGALRKEWGSALELERDAALKGGNWATEAKSVTLDINGTDSRESEDRKWQMAAAMMQAYFKQNRDNTMHIQQLVNAFPAFFDAAEKMVACDGQEALIQQTKEAKNQCRDMRMDLDMARSRVRTLEEMNKDLSNRMTANGVPI